MTTPLGDMLLSTNSGMLTGAYFIGQKDCPLIDGLPAAAPASRDPTAGLMHGLPTRRFKVYRHEAQADLFMEPEPHGETSLEAGEAAEDTAGDAAGGRARVAAANMAEGLEQDVAAGGTSGPVPGSQSSAAPEGLDGVSLQLMQPDTPSEAIAVFQQACSELTEYFARTRRSFSVPLLLEGTEFQKKVWNALLAIPYGEYVSYGDVAVAAGLGRGHGRPVGTAVGRNPLTIIVPCHRVLSSAGRLNGYTGGLNRKYALLELEGFSMAG
jgi:methylated-DNA-[protein]-cysteine S-methyltransferase